MRSRKAVAGSAAAGLTGAELAAWRGFLLAHATLVHRLDAEMRSAHKLQLASYEVLLLLCDAPGQRMRMTELARAVRLSLSGLSRLVGRLERERLARRERCADDARGSYAVLTEAGWSRVREARATHLAGVRTQFLDLFSSQEIEQFARSWERIVTRAPARRTRSAAAAGKALTAVQYTGC